jgi:hypothetical protein
VAQTRRRPRGLQWRAPWLVLACRRLCAPACAHNGPGWPHVSRVSNFLFQRKRSDVTASRCPCPNFVSWHFLKSDHTKRALPVEKFCQQQPGQLAQRLLCRPPHGTMQTSRFLSARTCFHRRTCEPAKRACSCCSRAWRRRAGRAGTWGPRRSTTTVRSCGLPWRRRGRRSRWARCPSGASSSGTGASWRGVGERAREQRASAGASARGGNRWSTVRREVCVSLTPVCRGHNLVNTCMDATRHAELVAVDALLRSWPQEACARSTCA